VLRQAGGADVPGDVAVPVDAADAQGAGQSDAEISGAADGDTKGQEG
jgi:large subunit ribosomal protein L3